MESLRAWQWRLYPEGHTTRANLALHVATVPLFQLGTLAVIAAPFTAGWLAAGGAAGVVVALAAQGRGHKTEQVPPVPFEGPWNFVARFFTEQFVSFPRYLLSGRLAAAWRAAR